jgi:hypothetical protein
MNIPSLAISISSHVSGIPSGKHTKNYGKSPFLMGKSTVSMAIFNRYVSLPGRVFQHQQAPQFVMSTATGQHRNQAAQCPCFEPGHPRSLGSDGEKALS